jgi:hypothetical protein
LTNVLNILCMQLRTVIIVIIATGAYRITTVNYEHKMIIIYATCTSLINILQA